MAKPHPLSGQERRPELPAALVLRLFLPFAAPIFLTVILIFTIGEAWPRTVAPGSGLKLPGLVLSALTAAWVWHSIQKTFDDPRVHKFAAVVCGVTGLMGWPVWTTGVLPSLNGASLSQPQSATMRLDRLDTTRPSKRPGFYYWAWLEPARADSPVAGGRYFIAEDVYYRWAPQKPAEVRVIHAKGAFGAEVVLAYR